MFDDILSQPAELQTFPAMCGLRPCSAYAPKATEIKPIIPDMINGTFIGF
jgi:hypothetical protein